MDLSRCQSRVHTEAKASQRHDWLAHALQLHHRSPREAPAKRVKVDPEARELRRMLGLA